MKNENGETPLMNSLQGKNSKIGEILIEKGADLNQEDKKGNTALYYAVTNSLDELVILLIGKGADLHFK